MNGFKITHVYNINNQMVIAETPTEAIELYMAYTPDSEVRSLEQMHVGSYAKDYDAIIKGE